MPAEAPANLEAAAQLLRTRAVTVRTDTCAGTGMMLHDLELLVDGRAIDFARSEGFDQVVAPFGGDELHRLLGGVQQLLRSGFSCQLRQQWAIARQLQQGLRRR